MDRVIAVIALFLLSAFFFDHGWGRHFHPGIVSVVAGYACVTVGVLVAVAIIH